MARQAALQQLRKVWADKEAQNNKGAKVASEVSAVYLSTDLDLSLTGRRRNCKTNQW